MQLVTCLATDASLTADQWGHRFDTVCSNAFVEIDHEIVSSVLLLRLAKLSRRVVASYKRKYMHEVLANRLFNRAKEKV